MNRIQQDTRDKSVIYLSLGSNIGNRMTYLQRAIEQLASNPQIEIVNQSTVYETEPLEVREQRMFLNMVVSGETTLSPEKLMDNISQIEQQVGRKNRFEKGPREIDIDIIFYNAKVIDKPRLRIPHPGFHKRKFVLIPMNQLAPGFISPTHNKSISKLLKECSDDSIVQPYNHMI